MRHYRSRARAGACIIGAFPFACTDMAIASRFSLPPGPWATVLDGLCAHFPAIDRQRWLDRMARGRVLDEQDHAVGPERPYRAGLRLRYYREVPDEAPIPFEEQILYRDDHLLVADKPHFLAVVPAGRYVEQTLLARLARALGGERPLAPLHRIDRGTAGLVLFSLNAGSRARYQALFAQRHIVKRYEALAPPLPQLDFPYVHRSRLQRGEPFFRMQELPGPPNSETRIDVLERGSTLWRYALQPVTGRKHQLRVHLSALGAPIDGDDLYPEIAPRTSGFERPLRLLARALAFNDPLTGEARRFESRMRLPGSQ